MKELSIEEKAKHYDEALKVAKSNYETIVQMDNDCTFSKVGLVNTFHHMFPELKESDDEKIRKALIELVHDTTGDSLWVDYNVHKEDALAWLEKQGKNNMGISEATKQKLEDSLNGALEKETPESWNEFLDEQKPADKVKPKFKTGDIIIPKDGGHEPWQIIQVDILDKKYRFNDGYVIRFSQEDDYELVEQKPAWSKEDEENFKGVMDALKFCNHEGVNPYDITPLYLVSWVKSLKSRYTWKPSDEQMKALTFACIKNANIDKSSIKALYDLKEQLKKLREE